MKKIIIENGVIFKIINEKEKAYVGANGEIIQFKSKSFKSKRVNTFQDEDGYMRVFINGKAQYVHNVVYEHFIWKIIRGYKVSHKDLNKKNNNKNNLILVPIRN